MTHNEKVRSQETQILKTEVDGYACEVVKIDGVILLYADGYCMGEMYEEESAEAYIEQIREILE